MLIERLFTNDGHVHRFVVSPVDDGWQVREEEDAVVLRQLHREDWHRVERDALVFGVVATGLVAQGWRETDKDQR